MLTRLANVMGVRPVYVEGLGRDAVLVEEVCLLLLDADIEADALGVVVDELIALAVDHVTTPAPAP